MAWRIVVQPNGKMARFSEVVDNFTDYDMTPYETLVMLIKKHDMRLSAARGKIKRAEEDEDRYTKCMEIITAVHGQEEAGKVQSLLEGKAANVPN